MEEVSFARWAGYGPWLVREDCPAPLHNSLRAVRGRMSGSNSRDIVGLPPCICPRALERRLHDNANKGGISRSASTKPKRPPTEKERTRMPSYMHLDTPMPDLTAGRCNSRTGRALMDATIGQGQVADLYWIRAKALCETCPVMRECGQWALTAESPAGNWGMVYGGMTPADRRTAKRRRMKWR